MKIYKLINLNINYKINNFYNIKNFKIYNKYCLFQQNLLLKKKNSNIIESNNKFCEITLTKKNYIYFFDKKYKDNYLINIKINYNILYNFNNIILNKVLKKNKNLIKGRLTNNTKNNKKVLINILGIIFPMNTFDLNENIKDQNFKTKNKKFFYLKKFNKKKIVNNYKLKYLYFKVICFNKTLKKKYLLSRVDYVKNFITKKITKKKIYRPFNTNKIFI